MDKCREAFEAKYRELHPNDKCTLMANGNYSGWIKQDHWWAWQSRQAEVDEANAKSQMCRDEKTHAINRWSQIRKEVEEKDKRIKQALSELESLHNKKWAEWKEQADMHSQGEANAYEHAMQILEKVLRGEHE